MVRNTAEWYCTFQISSVAFRGEFATKASSIPELIIMDASLRSDKWDVTGEWPRTLNLWERWLVMLNLWERRLVRVVAEAANPSQKASSNAIPQWQAYSVQNDDSFGNSYSFPFRRISSELVWKVWRWSREQHGAFTSTWQTRQEQQGWMSRMKTCDKFAKLCYTKTGDHRIRLDNICPVLPASMVQLNNDEKV